MRLGSCLLLVCLLTVSLVGQRPTVAHWPRFRGPNGSGVSETDKPPTTFGPSSNRLWQAGVPPGHCSPTIWGDHIFVTALENSTLVVVALRRRDGRLLWRRPAPSGQLEKVHPFSNPAASTPATDGQRVYTYFGSYGLLAHDFTGKEVWRKACPRPPRNLAPRPRRSSSMEKSFSSAMGTTVALSWPPPGDGRSRHPD